MPCCFRNYTVLYGIIFQIEEVWKYKMGIFSIPMTQGLPYEIFMRQLVFEMTERGQLNQVLKKWEDTKPDCGAILRSGNPLSWQKLITVFVIVKMGIIISLAILFIEKMHHTFLYKNCLNVQEANMIKLQHVLMKIECNLKDENNVKLSTIETLVQEMKHYDSLLNDKKRKY